MRAMVRYAFLTLLFALVTRALGWWGVPIAGAVWAYLAGGALRSPWDAGLGAMFGWAGILVWTDTTSPIGELARRAGGVVGVPPAAFVAATLLYGGLLAWSAAMVLALLIPKEETSAEEAETLDDRPDLPLGLHRDS